MKVTLSMEELERKALAEMRARPGCQTLKAVDVEYTHLRADTNWTLCPFSEGRIDPAVLHNALEITVEKLRHRYELRTPAISGNDSHLQRLEAEGIDGSYKDPTKNDRGCTTDKHFAKVQRVF